MNAEFVNPYGVRSTSQDASEVSSENLSQFGTARDYPDFDMQNDLFWYDEKDNGDFMTPSYEGRDFFGCPSEDKFVMTSENKKQHEDSTEKDCLFYISPLNDENELHVVDYYHVDSNHKHAGCTKGESKGSASSCSAPFCKCCAGAGGFYGANPADYSNLSSKETDLYDFQLEFVGDIPADCDSAAQHKINKTTYAVKRGSTNDWVEDCKGSPDFHIKVAEKDFIPDGIESYEVEDGGKINAEPQEPDAVAEGEDVADELLMYNTNDDEYDVFDLRIIHRKNRFVGNSFLFSFFFFFFSSWLHHCQFLVSSPQKFFLFSLRIFSFFAICLD